jgi:type VI secretion system secreted protein Hcp
MDLILLQPGNAEVFGGLIDGADDNHALAQDGREIGDIKFGQCIELVSLHQGMKQQITTDPVNLARTSGRPVITEFTCVKYVDKTSVTLNEYCLRAQSLSTDQKSPTKIFILRKSNENFDVLMTIELRDAIISEIQFQSHPNDMPTEQFKLSFTEILWTYSVQGAGKANPGNFTSWWSIARNRSIAQSTD